MIDTALAPLAPEAAEALGLRAVAWVIAQEELAGSLLGSSGLSADDLPERVSDPEFLGFVLDFLMADEEALLAFCADENIKPDRPMRARAALPGGNLPHWT